MTTINILVYTDVKAISLDDDKETKRLTILRELLETKMLGFADFKLFVINRFQDFAPGAPGTPRKLTRDLLKSYDQIWMFGFYQKSVPGPFCENFGGPDNELDNDEVAALRHWMSSDGNCGGILIAGDHSEYAPGGTENDPVATYQCLGRALGHRVPRAGELRRWEGPPTNLLDSSFDTLVRTATDSEKNPDLQEDALPQTIVLVTQNPDAPTPHRIFMGKDDTITIFPDHLHEGEVIIPEHLGGDWPASLLDPTKKPSPKVVAFGCDKRSCKQRAVLAVYDGDEAGVGRIVADSSWHHYMYANLKGFADGNNDQALDQLSYFYHNLALYLTPLPRRMEMARALFSWTVNHTEVLEERGNHPLFTGKVALKYLSKKSTPFEIAELLQTELSTQTALPGERFDRLISSAVAPFLPSQELVIGAVVNGIYRACSTRLKEGGERFEAAAPHQEVVMDALREAFGIHDELLKTAAAATADVLKPKE